MKRTQMKGMHFLGFSLILCCATGCGGDLGDGGPDSGHDGSPDSSADTGPDARDSAPDTPDDGGNDAGRDGDPDSDRPDADPDGPTGPLNVSVQALSGTRLRAQWYESADGHRLFNGWYDTELDISCKFQMAADGSSRCMPWLDGITPEFSSRFADDACTQRVADSRVYCDVTYVVERISTCPQHLVVYESSGVFEGQAYNNSFGCSALYPDSRRMFRVGAPVLPSTFVEGSYEQGTEAGGLAPVYIVGDDGSRRFLYFHDLVSGFDCEFLRTSESAAHCLPKNRAHRFGYTDSDCRTEALLNNSCDFPQIGIEFDDMCKDIFIPYSLGDRVSQERYFSDGSGSCNEIEFSNPQLTLYESGPPADQSLYVRADVVEGAGEGRLRSTEIVNEHFMIQGELLDSQRDEVCFVGLASDGTYRCLPKVTTGQANWFHIDPECSIPIAQSNDDIMCPGPTPLLWGFDPTCPGRRSYYSVGDLVTPERLFLARNDCEEFPVYDAEFYEQGPEIPPSDFALFEERRD